MPYAFHLPLNVFAPSLETFLLEYWALGGIGNQPPSKWKVLSLGEFGPIFPWASLCAVMTTLSQSATYWDSTFRVTGFYVNAVTKKRIATSILGAKKAPVWLAWKGC